MLIRGAGVTLIIALFGTVVGSIIGLMIGVFKSTPIKPSDPLWKRAGFRVINFILVSYIEIFRSTPMMVQAMVIFYGYASITGTSLNPLYAGMGIVSINTGAYMAEIVRGGILSIDKGQYEAAHSIGMTHSQTMIKIVLPQAIRNIMPALGNELVINTKDSCVLSVISVTELFFQAKSVASVTYMYFETFFVLSVMYFIMIFAMTRLLRYFERRMDGPDSYTVHGSQSMPDAVIKVNKGDANRG